MYARCPASRPLAVVAREQLGDLRRDEARELGALSLDPLEQPRVRDRYRRLVGEGLHELDVLVEKRLGLDAHDVHRSDQLALDDDRHTEQCPVLHELRGAPRVFGIGVRIGNVHDLSR